MQIWHTRTPAVTGDPPGGQAMATRNRRSGGAAWAAMLGAAIALAVACGGGDKKPAATPTVSADVQALRQVFTDAIARWNAKDLDGFVAHFTEQGLVSSFGEAGQSAAQAREALQPFFASQPLKNPRFSQETASGTSGSFDVVFQLGPTLLHSKFALTKTASGWLIDHEDSDLPVIAPPGTPSTSVELRDFAFGVDTDAIAKAQGALALTAKNVGKQEHELALARIPKDLSATGAVEKLAASQGADVPGIVFMGGVSAKPGEQRSLVLAEGLPAGHYLLVCFRSDTSEGPDGTPHALKGMVRDFTVQ